MQTWPAHNYATTLPFIFIAPAAFNYQLTSPYWTDTSDGKLAGVDMTRLPDPLSNGLLPISGASANAVALSAAPPIYVTRK